MTDRSPPAAHGPADPPGWAPRLARRVLLSVFAVGALLGLVVCPPLVTFVVAPVAAALAAVATSSLYRAVEQRAPLRVLLWVGSVVAGMPPFLAGLHLLGVVGGGLAVVSLGLLAVLAADSIARLDAAPRERPPSTGLSDPEDAELRRLLHALPGDLLFEEWRASHGFIAGRQGGPQYAAAVRLRELLLDEMDRRDPDGVERWLDDGAWLPPEHQIRGDRDLPG